MALDSDFVLKAPWRYNRSFEQNFDEWINWGKAEVEKNSTNAKESNNNVKVASSFGAIQKTDDL